MGNTHGGKQTAVVMECRRLTTIAFVHPPGSTGVLTFPKVKTSSESKMTPRVNVSTLIGPVLFLTYSPFTTAAAADAAAAVPDGHLSVSRQERAGLSADEEHVIGRSLGQGGPFPPVSYTHLTLPTSDLV